MNKFRTIVMVGGAILLVSLIAILAIIIARGGKLGDGGFVETGIIKILSKPEDVTVYVDGERVNLQDKQISNLEDKEYLIKVTREGYTDWEKTIKAEPGIVIEVFAQLFPTSLNLTEITNSNIDKLFYSADGQYAVYIVKDSQIGSNLGLWRLRLSKPTITIIENKPIKLSNLTQKLKDVINSSDYEMELSPDNRFVKIHNIEKNEYYILNAELYNEPETSLNEDLGFAPDKIDWFNNSSSLIITKENTLFEYDLQEKTSTLISLTPGKTPVYSVANSRIVLYNHNNKNFEIYEGNRSESLTVENINLPEEIDEIHVSKLTPNLIIFKKGDTHFYLNTEKSFITEIGKNLTLIEFSRNGKGALFIQDGNLISYTVEEIVSAGRFVPHYDNIQTDFDPDTQTAKWSTDSAHIVTSGEKDGVKMLSIYDKEGDNKNELLVDKRINTSAFTVSADSSSVFLLLNDEIKENGTDDILRSNLYELNLEAE